MSHCDSRITSHLWTLPLFGRTNQQDFSADHFSSIQIVTCFCSQISTNFARKAFNLHNSNVWFLFANKCHLICLIGTVKCSKHFVLANDRKFLMLFCVSFYRLPFVCRHSHLSANHSVTQYISLSYLEK